MATITLSAGNMTATPRTISNADIDRIKAAAAAAFPGKTNQQLIDMVLDRIIKQVTAFTKSYEQGQQTVAPIVIT